MPPKRYTTLKQSIDQPLCGATPSPIYDNEYRLNGRRIKYSSKTSSWRYLDNKHNYTGPVEEEHIFSTDRPEGQQPPRVTPQRSTSNRDLEATDIPTEEEKERDKEEP